MSGMPDLDLFYPGSLSLLKLESKRLVSHGADLLTVGKFSSSEQLLKGGKIHPSPVTLVHGSFQSKK